MRRPFLPLLITVPALTIACSEANSETSELTATGQPGSVAFELESLSLPPGARIELNRALELTFNAPVDFATVSLNTIQIRSDDDGSSAAGSFKYRALDPDGDGLEDDIDRRVIVFEPTGPVRADHADAGLKPATGYSVVVPGRADGAANTLRSIEGRPLEKTVTRSFETPASTDPADLFLDEVEGPPAPVIRSAGSNRRDATRVELGGDSRNPVHFELDPDAGRIVAGSEEALPLNVHGDPDARVVFELFFNQMIRPTNENLASLRLEFLDAAGRWRPLATRVELVSNGATPHVRLEPVGVLPGESAVRAAVLPGFADVVGQTGLQPITGFAEAPTAGTDRALLATPGSSGDAPTSEPGGHAARTNGGTDGLELGNGGTEDDFDWYVRNGEIFVFDTTSATVVGGPDGIPKTVRNFVDGIVDVRDLVIEEGGEIRVQGPHPMQINASRDVIVRGELDLSGFAARDVATLNTGNQPEIGGAGAAGGGQGGNASETTDQTTLRGGTGLGAFQAPGLGGQGGESQFAPAVLGKDARRPGGGGGGRFARDACDPGTDPDCNPPTGPFGLAAEAGFDGNSQGTGAITGMMPAQGGAPGTSVFVDGDPTNDFFGVGFALDANGRFAGEIRGELPGLWAGAGGGGGGDAIPGVIDDPWNPGADEKGGAGGGGAGGLHVRALGEIVFGRSGRILADGGRGATGENTLFLDHVGGSGGAGSGGHVVLESATQIDFTDRGTNLGAGATTWIEAIGGIRRRGAATSGGEVSFGGAGGPGVVQLHVPKPTLRPGPDPSTTNIVVPFLQAASRDPLGAIGSPTPFALFPTFRVAPSAPASRGAEEPAAPTAGGVDLGVGNTRFESGGFLRVPTRY